MLRMQQLDDDTLPQTEAPFLEYELEFALLFGAGSSGQLVIRHAAIWKREWREWRETILPKFKAAFPGRRPAAAYIAGELPMRPVQMEMPLTHPKRDRNSVYVIGEDNSGFWYRDWPEPYQRDESRWLYEIGEIDGTELRAAATRTRRAGLKLYQWEQGVER